MKKEIMKKEIERPKAQSGNSMGIHKFMLQAVKE